MGFWDLIQRPRSIGLRLTLLEISFLIFIVGFFLMPYIKWQNNFFYIFLLAPYLIMINRNTFKMLCRSRIFLLSLLFIMYLLATLIWGHKGNSSDYMHIFIRSLSVLVFYALTMELSLSDKWFMDRVFTIMIWASLLGTLIYIFVFHYPFRYPPMRLNDIGVLRNAIQAGSTFGMILIILYYSVLGEKRFWANSLYILSFVSLLAIVLLTQSRGPLMALFLAFLVGSFMSRDSKMLIILLCMALGVVLFLSSGEGFLYDMIITRGTSNRLYIFQCVIDKIQEKFILGHGILLKFSCVLSNGTVIPHPHNLYLSIWLYGGLVGLSLLILLLAKGLWQGYLYFIRERNCMYVVWIIYTSICVFTGNHNVIISPHPIYLFFWMPFGFLSAFEITTRIHHNQAGETDRIARQPES